MLCRAALQAHALATNQVFDLGRTKPLPDTLLPYLRLAAASTAAQVQQVGPKNT